MKVVQLLTQPHGGPVDHAVDVAVELAARGHDCTVVLPESPAARRLRAAGVRTSAQVPHRLADLHGTAAALRALRAQGADVVHCQDRRAGLVGRALAWATGARTTVYTLHGVPDSLSGLVAGNVQVSPRRRRDPLLYLHAERLLARVGGGPLVVPSEALRRYVLEHVGVPPARVHVVPNGVDVRRFRPGAVSRTSGALDVLWVGALTAPKQLDVLLRAVAEVPAAVLRVAGSGPCEQGWRSLVDELGIADRVTWLGWVDDPAGLLAGADVVALSSGAENLPLVVLQAMACGAALAVTSVGGVPEVVTDDVDGLLVPAADPSALAAALQRLADDAVLRARLGARARATVEERFALPMVTDRLLEVYACAR